MTSRDTAVMTGTLPGPGQPQQISIRLTLPAALPTGTTPMLTAGSAFPKPYYDSTSTGNSLSDVAMYYWVNDLRTSGSVRSLPTNIAASMASAAVLPAQITNCSAG